MTTSTPVINNFKLFYESLPSNKQAEYKESVIAGCNISKPTFYRALKNTDIFSPAEKDFIAKLSKKKVKDLF